MSNELKIKAVHFTYRTMNITSVVVVVMVVVVMVVVMMMMVLNKSRSSDGDRPLH